MVRSTVAVAIGAILVVSAVAFGASAFTSAKVSRQASIQVVSDSSGPLQLGSGGTGISSIENGQLAIDVSDLSGASGVNEEAKYTFGNPDADDASSVSPSDYVFSVTNSDDVSHSVSMRYDPSNSSVTANNVVFEVYTMGDSTNDGPLTTVKADNTSASFSASPDTTYYVVTKFDTGVGSTTDIEKVGTLSGTLAVSV